MYKTSFYNFIFRVNSFQKYLLYNSMRNGLYEASHNEGEILKSLTSKKSISEYDLKEISPKFKSLLFEGGFIIKSNQNEHDLIKKRRESVYKLMKSRGAFVLTIAPTLDCNMACEYCYEGLNKSREHMSNQIVDHLLDFLEKEISGSLLVDKFDEISVTWYGGEPLLAPEMIRKMSKTIIDFSKKNKIKYSSSIVTNGTNLTKENWLLLKQNKITNVQITIDGSSKTHNQSRPLIGDFKESYDLILRNLKIKPVGINVTIRINTDKEVAKELITLLEDLESYGIWPNNAKEIKLQLAKKDLYPFVENINKDIFLDQKSFHKIDQDFREMQLHFYNNWAIANCKKKAKRKYYYPEFSSYVCKAAQFPYGLTIGPNGYIFKCWEYINDESKRLINIKEDYSKMQKIELNNMITKFDKTSFDEECKKCKYLPICEINCVSKHIDPKLAKQCTRWKFLLKDILVEQYELAQNSPNEIHQFLTENKI